MKKTPFNIRSAYGQLILLIFVPIGFLAAVGGCLVFFEVRQSVMSEQEVVARASLVHYQTVVRPLLANAPPSGVQKLTLDNAPALSGDGGHSAWWIFSPRTLAYETWLERVVVLDKDGKPVMDTGLSSPNYDGFNPKADKTQCFETASGSAYGMAMVEQGERYWLFVEMDDKPLTITYYRVALALIITGLITLLLLLLILNSYSKRWIAPIYEMRLYLQRLSVDNLSKSIKANTDGEFFLLQRDFVQAMRRLDTSFTELKAHAKETEADLQQAFDEMEMQNITIRKARDTAVSSSQAKSAFLANISHELRTPLNSIDGFINLLARHDGLTGEQSLYVQTIKKSSAHLLALVNDVLDFSKIEAGKLILDHHEFDLYAAIYDVVDMFSPSALEKHLRLSVLFYHDVPTTIVGDSLRIKQILTNLVGNAIKFTDTGAVVVRVGLSEEKDGFLSISVEDTGKGVSEADKAQLFVSFGQGDLSVTRRYGGTGLGLVISKELTEMMGGSIGFFDNNSENVAKVGATFWFEMPLHTPEMENGTDSEPELVLPNISTPLSLLVWINHTPAMQVLKASLAPLGANVVFAIGLADLLEQLDNPNHGYNWVIVDYFGQDAAQDDVGAVLRQIRSRYDGKLSAYGYQVGMDNAMLAECQTSALYEPMDKRQLYAMLSNQSVMPDPIRQLRFEGRRVLAVDDHLPNLLVLEALLGEFGVEVITASSGFDAIEIMTRTLTGAGQSVDLIFMDIQMPRMSGLEASLQIRKLEDSHHATPTPIIALTAHGLSDERDKLVASGLNDYVGKPIGYSQLAQTLQRWLNAPKATDTQDTPEPTALPSVQMAATYDGDHLADVDWQDALERSAHKAELARTLLGMVIDTADNEKQALERAWADRDRASLADIAHRMVGAGRYTGVPRLRQASEAFEAKCRADITNVSASQFISMRPSYRELIDALDRLGNVELDELLQGI